MEKNQPLSILSSKLFTQLEEVYSNLKPDISIVQGDTTTALISSICSFYHKVPVAHIEAGLRTKQIYFPFPEELNRQTISNIAKYNFCPTQLSADNLIKENRDISSVYVVGNTIIDALNNSYTMINNNQKVSIIKNIIQKITNKFSVKHIILLTIHRRENYGDPLINIMKAVYEILRKYENIIIIYPIHLNPNVLLSIKQTLPISVLNCILANKEIENKDFNFLNRLVIVKPLDYFSSIYLLKQSFFVMTDSGGIQEEAVFMQKPILILRNTTERIEGVKANAAKLVGTDFVNVFYYVEKLLTDNEMYKSMIQNPYIYGNGSASKQIVDILKEGKRSKKNYIYKSVVIVLTVWKRNNLLMQLNLIKNQTILKWMNVSVIIFQNANHINITSEANEWKRNNIHILVDIIQSTYETGYYGRFLVPLTFHNSDSYFIICDDDVIIGSQYFENMLRVVDNGCLATRNGRFIDCNGIEITADEYYKGFITWEEDLEYDFGGHIWCGKIEWLKLAWQHPTPTLLNCEDAWISIVLKKYYNIKTKIPKCPYPKFSNQKPSMCACSDISAMNHIESNLGNSTIKDSIRSSALKTIKSFYNFIGIMEYDMKIYNHTKYSKIYHKNSIYNTTGDIMGERCMFFI